MSASLDTRTPEQRLQDEAARWRKTLREEQARHAATWAVLREANRTLLRVALGDRLADPRDFEVFIGADLVTDSAGKLVWGRVALLLDELLEARPHLAAPRRDRAADPQPGALEWLASGDQHVDDLPHGALEAPRDRPAAGGNGSSADLGASRD